MKAIAIVEKLPLDDPRCFVEIELPKPAPSPRDLLVRVKAVSVNPVDYKVWQRRAAAAGEPQVLGWDAAGMVEAVGSEVSLFKPGDEVFYAGDITRPGSNAEFQVVDERIVARKPRTLSFAEAAALPLTTISFDDTDRHWVGMAESQSPRCAGTFSGTSHVDRLRKAHSFIA